jgi:hypothetical protein
MNYFELSSPVLLGPDISCNGQNTSNPQPAGFKDEQQRRSTSLERTLPQYSHVHPQPQSRSPRPLASSDFGNTDEDDGEEEGDETDDPDMISPFQSRGKTLSPKKSPGLAGLGEVGAGQGGTSPSKRLYDQMKGSAVYKVSIPDDVKIKSVGVHAHSLSLSILAHAAIRRRSPSTSHYSG